MRVAGHQPVAVVDLQAIAIALTLADEADLALGRGIDRRADRPSEIESGMEGGMQESFDALESVAVALG